jgi:hypothetical protein
MTDEARSPAQYAADIDSARERLVTFVESCTDEQWDAAPVEVVRHLRRSGTVISALVAGCAAEDLQAGDGMLEGFAQVAVRHPDSHRTEIEAALAAQAARP